MEYFIAMIDNNVIVKKVSSTNHFHERLIGLLFKKGLSRDEGLLISPCNQIHTFGMKFCIDAVFLSSNFSVIHIEHNMKKGQISKYIKGASKVLELSGGTAKEKNITLGKTIIFTR